jgi:hypothetical protein
MLRAPACKWIYDERTRRYRGKGKVIGRIAGQLITELLTLLKRDQERVAHAEVEGAGEKGIAPAPCGCGARGAVSRVIQGCPNCLWMRRF